MSLPQWTLGKLDGNWTLKAGTGKYLSMVGDSQVTCADQPFGFDIWLQEGHEGSRLFVSSSTSFALFSHS
jgi:hypothetical protein